MLINLTIKQVGGESFLYKREVEIWRHSRQLLGLYSNLIVLGVIAIAVMLFYANKKKKEGTEALRSIRNEKGEGVV